VTLEAWSATEYGSTTTTVYIDDPDVTFATDTICVDDDATPVAGAGGCPSGASVLQENIFNDAVATALGANGCGVGVECRRILFKGGDTFNRDGAASVYNHDGPGIIGTYDPDGTYPPAGVNAKAIIDAQGTVGDILAGAPPECGTPYWSSSCEVSRGWRIMDLEVLQDAAGASSSNNFGQYALYEYTLFYRIKRLEGDTFYSGGLSGAQKTHCYDGDWYGCIGTFFVDNELSLTGNTGNQNVFYFSTVRAGIVGNKMGHHGCFNHLARIAGESRWQDLVISHNDFGSGSAHPDCSAPGAVLDWTVRCNGNGDICEYFVLRKNIWRDNSTVFGAQITAGSNVWDGRIQHVIVENNQFDTDEVLNMCVKNSTVRNNIFGVGHGLRGSIGLDYRASNSSPTDWIDEVYIYNNSFASTATGGDILKYYDGIGKTVGNVYYYNNINYANNTGVDIEATGFPVGTTMYEGLCSGGDNDGTLCQLGGAECTGGGSCVSGNLDDDDLASSPYAGSVPANPIVPSDFYLTGAGASTAIDAGFNLGRGPQ
jgi:hypothetical protein